MLTGSYHNYFRVFDVDDSGDVVLQADKSAFKAKKMGGPLPGNKAGAKNGVRPGGLRDNMAQDTLDFNKKILHSSWHPREDTIAVSGVRAVSIIMTLTISTDRSDEQPVPVQCRLKAAALYAYPTCPACTYLPYDSCMLSYTPPLAHLPRRLSSLAEPRLTHRDTETRIYRHQTDCPPTVRRPRRIACPCICPLPCCPFPLFSAHSNDSAPAPPRNVIVSAYYDSATTASHHHYRIYLPATRASPLGLFSSA